MFSSPEKPLGRRCYGHIPHLPGSRVGPGDHVCPHGQARIAIERRRDAQDRVIVLEKLDGSNVGVARIGDQIVALIRAGYRADAGRYEQHRHFDRWVRANAARFVAVLAVGERLCGEWLAQTHGTRYALTHEPFVAFDLMRDDMRLPYDALLERVKSGLFTTPKLLHWGPPIGIAEVLRLLGPFGHHGAVDPVEGAIWRVERQRRRDGNTSWEVDFLAKYVQHDKRDGRYLPEISGGPAIWNATVGWDGIVNLLTAPPVELGTGNSPRPPMAPASHDHRRHHRLLLLGCTRREFIEVVAMVAGRETRSIRFGSNLKLPTVAKETHVESLKEIDTTEE